MMKAHLIAKDLQEYLMTHETVTAQVHSVFTSSFNILSADGTFITVADCSRDRMPMGVILDRQADKGWPVQAGDRIVFQSMKMFFNENNPGISLQDAALWDPAPVMVREKADSESCARAMECIQNTLRLTESNGIAPLINSLGDGGAGAKYDKYNPYCQFIAPDLNQFLMALDALDWQAALEKAKKLVGFGPGLTPACDDFLTAVMACLYYAFLINPDQFKGALFFNRETAEWAKNRTPLVSASMLCHAAAGKVSHLYRELILASLFGSRDDLDAIIKDVAQLGASSGTDFLFGFYCVLKILCRYAEFAGSPADKVWK